jgi:hypothetical protein
LIRLGRSSEALPIIEQALATCERLGDRWGTAFMLRTRGELYLSTDLARADADLCAAHQQWTALDVPVMRARTERDLATLRAAQGNASAAAALRETAMDTFRAYGAREFSELALAAGI